MAPHKVGEITYHPASGLLQETDEVKQEKLDGYRNEVLQTLLRTPVADRVRKYAELQKKMPHWIMTEVDKHKEVWYREVRETYRPDGTRNPVQEMEDYFNNLPDYLREEARANWKHKQQSILIKPFPKIEDPVAQLRLLGVQVPSMGATSSSPSIEEQPKYQAQIDEANRLLLHKVIEVSQPGREQAREQAREPAREPAAQKGYYPPSVVSDKRSLDFRGERGRQERSLPWDGVSSTS
jgi:hypothetical protein